MLCPSHPPWLNHPNNIIWWSVQVMKFLVTQSSSASCYFLPLRSKFSTADKGWSSSFGVGQGANSASTLRNHVMKCYTGPQTWMDSMEWPRKWKMGMRFGTWNNRSLYMAGSPKSVASKLAMYNISSGSTRGQMGQWWQSASRWLIFLWKWEC